MNDVKRALLAVVLGLFLFMLAPMLALWGLNTLSEQAKMGWHIPHGLATYFGVWAILLPFASGSVKS